MASTHPVVYSCHVVTLTSIGKTSSRLAVVMVIMIGVASHDRHTVVCA